MIVFDEDTGAPVKWAGGYRKRGAHERPPCRGRRGCPKGTPEESRAFTPANERCYQHYLSCRATTQFPDDEYVRFNAGIIFEVEQQYERHMQQMAAMFGGK